MRHYLAGVCAALLAQSATAAQTCDNSIIASTPDSRFSINGDEVTDNVTGLIWKRCSLGETGNDCSEGGANTYIWRDALLAAEAERAVTSDSWRLPNINELRSIVEERCRTPAINLSVFPIANINYPPSYWSGTPSADDNSSNAWSVSLHYGYSYRRLKNSYHLHVRLVRGGE